MANTKDLAYILFGIKHSGKSTQGQLLADRLECVFFDTDTVITEQTGLSPRSIYASQGPSGFMLAEEKACSILAEKYTGKKLVISTGGGICDNAPALCILRSMGVFIFLEVPECVAADRIIRKMTKLSDGTFENLPAYIAKKNPDTENDVRTIFHDFYTSRTATYRTIADVTVKLEDAPKNYNLEHILKSLSL
ncbi:MAG: shikimate kinase [Treponema sp.]